MKTRTPFKRLILRAVLRKVSLMVIRVLAVPFELDEVFRRWYPLFRVQAKAA